MRDQTVSFSLSAYDPPYEYWNVNIQSSHQRSEVSHYATPESSDQYCP